MTRRRKITLLAVAVASVLVAVGTVVVATHDRSSTLSVASTAPRAPVTTSTTEPQPATTSTSTSTSMSAAGVASPMTQRPVSRPRAATAVTTTTSAVPSRFPPDVQPGVVPPGRDADDPCFGPSVTPIAVAGTRSPDGRLWIALQHGSVGISDDRGTTWTWHCEVARADGLTIAPRTLIAWDPTNALAWGRRRSGQTVLLRTEDAGAT